MGSSTQQATQAALTSIDIQARTLALVSLKAEPAFHELRAACVKYLNESSTSNLELVRKIATYLLGIVEPRTDLYVNCKNIVNGDSPAAAMRKVVSGKSAEEATRWRLLELAQYSNIVQFETTRYLSKYSPNKYYLLDDAIDACMDLLQRRITRTKEQAGQRGSYLDLELVAGGTSLCGWVRINIQRYLMFNMLRDLSRNIEMPVELDVDTTANLPFRATLPGVSPCVADKDNVDLIHAERSYKQRGFDRTRSEARSIIETMDLAVAHRPLYLSERSTLLDEIDRNPHTALLSMRRLINGDDAGPLEELWQDWKLSQLKRVSNHQYNFQIAQLLAKSALAPWRKPTGSAIQRFTDRVLSELDGHELVPELVKSFIAHEFAPASAKGYVPTFDHEDWPDIAIMIFGADGRDFTMECQQMRQRFKGFLSEP